MRGLNLVNMELLLLVKTREIDEEKNIILPIWLDVSKDEVAKYSLDLADKYALNASEGIDIIADKIVGIVKK
jgi:hypothetical protein